MRDLSAFFRQANDARAEIAARWDLVHGEVYGWLQ